MMLYADMNFLKLLLGWLRRNISRKEKLKLFLNPVSFSLISPFYQIQMRKCSGSNLEMKNSGL